MEANWQSEMQATVLGGMNSGRAPGLIGENQFAYARNVSTRGGRARIRPRMVRRKTLFAGLPQGIVLFEHTGEIIVSISGQIVRVNPRDWSMQSLTSATTRNNALNRTAWFCETDGSLVIQDGKSWPYVYDGSSFRRFTEQDGDTLPIGTVMAYGNGRLAVATGPRSRNLFLGDIRQYKHQSELKFTETAYLTGGGSLEFRSPIKSLAYGTVVDTSTGKGPLLVGQRKQLHSVRTDITARDSWAQTDGFVTSVFDEHGIVGPDAYVAINQDVYFRALDGLRSLRLTASDYSGPGATPISREFALRLDYDTDWMLDGASLAYADNRLFFTHSPYLLDNFKPIHTGLGSLQFDLLSELGAKSSPAYEGEWATPPIVQLFSGDVSGEDRLFALCREGEANSIWEILPEKTYKLPYTREPFVQDAPRGVLETRVFYGQDPRRLKTFRKAICHFSGLKGYADVTVSFRAEGSRTWTQLERFRFQAAAESIGSPQNGERRGPIATVEATESIDAVTRRPLNVANGFQLRFDWCGEVTIDWWELLTEALTEATAQENPPEASAMEYESCPVEFPPYPESPPLPPSLVIRILEANGSLTDVDTDEPIDFGTFEGGASRDITLALFNEGGTTLVIDSGILSGAGYSIVQALTQTELAPGEFATVVIRFSGEGGALPPVVAGGGLDLGDGNSFLDLGDGSQLNLG